MTTRSARAVTPRATALVPLLYWLLIVTGLAGFTLKRHDGPAALLPLWTGTLMGVALGQILAWRRVRAWLPLVALLGCVSLAPALYIVLYQAFGDDAGTCVLAFLPAGVCAYLSLSERCGLVAFWYPAVLWMLALFEGQTPTEFDPRAALPIWVGLGALFLLFVQAREARRAALWSTHGNVRLARPVARSVLRASPLRAAAGIAWTGFAGAASIALAAWVAPHLLQADRSDGAHAAAAAPQRGAHSAAGVPCCPDPSAAERERAREYFSILRGADKISLEAPVACRTCTRAEGSDDGSTSGSSWGYTGAPGGTYAGAGESHGDGLGSYDGTYATGYVDSAPAAGAATPTVPAAPAEPMTASVLPSSIPPPQAAPTTPPHATNAGAPATQERGAPPTPEPSSAADVIPAPAPVAFGATNAASTSAAWPSPWRSALALAVGVLALWLLVRAFRRRMTLRHLSRPLWSEPVDQRVSNHWQRVLIGLRDAGIRPRKDERPLAFARRVGIDGMTTCATILERARHGVRLETTDLDAMDAAASAVYRAARREAGLAARATAWLRWPLA